MTDYIPLNLSNWANAPRSAWPNDDAPPLGAYALRGLPFEGGGEHRACMRLGPGGHTHPVTVPVNRSATWVVVAHRLVEHTRLDVLFAARREGGDPLFGFGETAALYHFNLANGTKHTVNIRDRYEISTVPTPGNLPFRANADHPDTLFPHESGSWRMAGYRLTEVRRGTPRWWVLWLWRNPTPDVSLASITLAPATIPVLVGGITLSTLDERPLSLEPAHDVIITLPDTLAESIRPPLHLDIDRGSAGYVYPLPAQPEAYLDGAFAGYGDPGNTGVSPAYAKVAAIPSATLTLHSDGGTLAQVNWGQLQQTGHMTTQQGVTFATRAPQRNWVHTTVRDGSTGALLPCRIHFRTPEGIPYQPHGHPAHVNNNHGSYFVDVGGDVRLGNSTYAYIDGQCQCWLPRGRVFVDIARGYEYRPLRTAVTIVPDTQTLEFILHRMRDMNAERWFSGDPHTHSLSAQGALFEAKAEDLNVAAVLQTQWGHMFSSIEEFSTEPVVSPNGRHVVTIDQENRQHRLGHLTLLGLKQPVMPWASDGPDEAEIGGTLDSTLCHWADAAHAQGATVIIPHFPTPNAEAAALIATGRADAVEMVQHVNFRHAEYYRYLNCGYRLPLAGGTDKMSNDVPVGLYRTYVHLLHDGLSLDAWLTGLRAGRTFISGGPLLRFTVNDAEAGTTLKLPPGGSTVAITGEARSVLPVHCLQLVHNGQVIAETSAEGGTDELKLEVAVAIEEDSWLALRAGGPNYTLPLLHRDQWQRGVMAHTSPVYLACGDTWEMFDARQARYMRMLIEGCIDYVAQGARHYRPGAATYPHREPDHIAWLQRPFHEAQAALRARLAAAER